MTREEKAKVVEELTARFNEAGHVYITDTSALTVETINELRRKCFEQEIELRVVKNTLAVKAIDQCEKDLSGLKEVLAGPTALMFSETANSPAKIIKEFRTKHDKPVLKAASIDSDIFLGDDQIAVLASLKSKDELLGEVISLLQSPAKNVISALTSGGSKLAGLMKALEERGEAA